MGRKEQLISAVPDILSFSSLLYIGANARRRQMLDLFINARYEAIVLEIWAPNVNDLMRLGFKTIEGDVRDIATLFTRRFDVVMWWHGPEHLPEDELERVLTALEGFAREVVVVACPFGRYEQGEKFGNVNEEHRSTLYPAFFKRIGWDVSTIGKKDVRGSNLLAWKRMT